jgi:hypothetical protein
MAELDATQMPEDIFPEEVIVDTPELEVVDQEEQEKPKSGGKIQMATEEAKKELAKKFIPKKTIISNLGEIKEPTPTVVKKATTEITKPVVQKPKEVKEGDLLKPDTQDDAAEYKKKYQENEVAALLTGKKPSAPVDVKFELERFLGGSPSSINWDAYDKSKQEEIRRAAAIAVQNDVDPNQDYSGVLTFISRITPNAIKSGIVSVESDLVSFAGDILKEFEKAKQKPGGFAKSLGVEPEAPKPLADGEVPTYKNLFEIGAKLSKRSEDYMFAAEINSGIKDKNIGKNATDLLFSAEPGDTWDGLTKLGLSVTQQLPQLIGLAATSSNPALMNALMFSTSTGRALTEEYKKDKDISDVDAMQSWGKGFASTLIENLYLGDIKALASAGGKIANLQMNGAKKVLKDFLDKNGKEKLRNEIKRTYFGASKDIVKNSFGEGGEEVITAITDFVVDRTEDGKWDQEEYDKLLSNIKESGLIGAATGFGVSAPLIKASVTPLTMEQKRKIGSFRQVANDPTASKEIRESAQKHADDIIKFNADQVARKYTVMAALPLEKRKTAIDIAGKIQALENGKAKLKDVEAEAVIDKDIDKLKQDWSKLIVGHAMETAAKDEAARMEAAKTTEVTAETTTPEVKLFNDTPEGRALISNYNATLKALNDKAKILIHSNALAMQAALIQGGMNSSLANAYANGGSHNGVNYSASSGLLATENSNPVIHVNAETADNLTIPHEITHVALVDLAKNNPEQFIVMRDKLLKAMSSSNSTPLVAFASQYGKGETTAEAEQLRAEEFITQMVAELASEGKKIDVDALQAIAQAIKQFLLDVASKLDSPMLTTLVNDAFANTTSKQELVDFFNKFAEALAAGRSLPTKTPMFDVGISPTRAAETMSNYVRQSILGEKGAAELDEYYNVNTRLNNLYRAKSLSLLGLTPAEVKIATGWELSKVDDIWRYEIEPSDMTIPLGLLSKAFTTGEFVVNINGKYVVDMQKERELNPNLREEDYKKRKSSFGVTMPIKQILGEYNLYDKAYPDLFNKISVEFKNDPKDDDFAGMYNENTKTITINLANTSVKNIKSLLIHEMQHAIQVAEGFPVGANPNVFLGNKEELKAEAQKAYDAYKGLDAKSKKLYQEKINISPSSIPEFSPYLIAENDRTVEELKIAEEQLGKLEDANPLFDAKPLIDLIKSKRFILENGINTKAYEMSAGEVEARTAQERADMTEEQRRGSLISDNQKIAPEDQIIIRNKIIEGKKQFEKLVEAAAEKNDSKQQIAPNGKPSKLTTAQYETVRTPEFKAWFGDWENDPENASKMVDENGEPKVYYHGTSKDKDFTAFKMPDNGAWFTESPETASDYAVQNDSQTSKYDWSSGKYLDVNTSPRVLPVFLNIKNPVDYFNTDIITPDDRSKLFGARNYKAVQKELFKKIVYSKTLEERQAGLGVDGLYFEPGVVVALNNPTQIKSATGNKGTFSPEKSDIRQQIFGKPKYEPGTSAAKEAQKANESTSLGDAWIATQKEMTERNVNVADALKNADMMQSFYNMYNKAGGTPYATRMFADARNEIYGNINGKKLNKKDKIFLDDIILLRRTIAIDENFDNRKAAGEKVDRPLHTSFTDYVTKGEVPLSKEEAQKQLDALKEKVYANNPEKLAELEARATRYFKAFSDILKYKLDNGLIDQGEYDMYKNYDYQPRKFLKFLLGDTPQSAFNTRGVQITKEEIAKISEGDTGYMMTDSEKLLKMGFVSAVNKVFTNRAISWMAEEMEGKNLSWLKPANVDKYANGTENLNPDGSPKLQEPNAGFRNMYYKKDGKRYAVQLKESFAREFQDEEMWDTRNWLYRTATKALGANVTSAMAVGINPAFIISNIPIDILSQVYYNNLYSSKFGVFGQMGKGFFGAIDKSLSIAKAKTGKGDNSDLLNLINEYGEAGGLMNTLAYETNVLGKVGDALGALGDISEMASKLTAYENKRNDLIREFQKKNGSDPNGVDYDKIKSQAAYEARAAMDYHRGGRTSKWLNGLIPFFNVTTQVGKISATYIKNNFPAFSKKVLQSGGAVMALTLYNMKMAGDDWENEDLKRAKRNKLIIMSPFKNADGTHSYTQIQVPTPIKAFWNVFQTMAEATYYKGYAPMLGTKVPPVDKDYNKEMMESLKMFVPVATSQIPSTAKFIYEYANNISLWNERALSQDALKTMTQSEEGEENKDVLSFYKTMAKGVSKITDGSIEISPERFQKASEDAFLTSPENQALLSGLYTIADQMTDLYVGGVDEKVRSKYIEDGDFTEAGQALLKTFGKRIVGTTDKTKNESFYDSTEDAKFIDKLNRQTNSERQDIAYEIKKIFKSYKDNNLPYTDARPEVMEYFKSLESSKDKEYASNYIETVIGKSKVELLENMPEYLTIKYGATSSNTKARAIYRMFTEKGQDPMTDSVLRKDLYNIGFREEVARQYKTIAEEKEKQKEKENKAKGLKSKEEEGLPEGFNPADYQPK